jgi:hypothetical protein
MSTEATSNYDSLDALVLGEFAGAPRVAAEPEINQAPGPAPAPTPEKPESAWQPTMIADEVVDEPKFLAKPRAGFGTRIATALRRRGTSEPVDVPSKDLRASASPLPPPAAARTAPASAPAPAQAASRPRAREASKPTTDGPESKTVAPRAAQPSAPASPKRQARGRAALKVAAVASSLVAVGFGSYMAGQRSVPLPRAASMPVDTAASGAGAAAFGLTPIPVSASAPAGTPMASASAASAAASAPTVPVPEAVLAAASANLPPMASLPPAIDERKVDQRPGPAAKGGAPAPGAPASTAAHAAHQQQDGLIALGGDAQQGQPATGSTEAATVPEGGQGRTGQGSASKQDSTDKAATGSVRKMKYGSMGITALTATSVVLVNGKRGQFAVTKDQALPDGSIVQAVDPKAHRISTNRGVIQLD